jgi:CDP-diacylglycerol--glycerol-3-phosphate 3-phosphatidyltransferase
MFRRPDWIMKHVPNALTIVRILLTPVLLWLLLTETFWGYASALGLFIIAAVSDYLDGMLAREFKVGSRLGQFLDPLADKVLVLGTFAVLAYLMPRQVPWWGVVLIALRDVAVTALRSWAESRGRSLRTLPLAKMKTTFQLTFLIATLVFLTASRMRVPAYVAETATWILASPIIVIAFLIVVVFTVGTGVVYFVRQEYSNTVKLDG